MLIDLDLLLYRFGKGQSENICKLNRINHHVCQFFSDTFMRNNFTHIFFPGEPLKML